MTDLTPFICWPWHLRSLGEDGPGKGALCMVCRRDVALPNSAGRRRPICTYCAEERGLVTYEDRPIERFAKGWP